MTSRALILFLATVLLPGGTLAIVGAVLVRQQQELLELRAEDQTILMAREMADSLEARLSRLAASAISDLTARSHERYPADNAMLFLGRVDGNGWTPPFDQNPPSSLGSSDFQRLLFQFRRVEADGRRKSDLAADFRNAALASVEEDQQAFLFIQEARVRELETDELRDIAQSGTEYFDEFGIPLSLYAKQLLGSGQSGFHTDEWLNYESISFADDLSKDSFAEGEHDVLRHVERSYAGISSWELGSDKKWIVTRIEDDLLGIRVDSLPPLLGGTNVQLNPVANFASLAPVFQGMFVDLERTPSESSSLALWIFALVLVLVVTSLGSYLLFRDARREKRLADLRAGFVSSVSHEVRTPLSAIRLYTDSLLAFGQGEYADWRQDLETISYETGRLTRMLDNVLRASRIEKGSDRYHRSPGDLGKAVEKAINVMMPALTEAKCSVEVRIEKLPATFDSDAIEQAVVNLLSNSSKYAPGSNVSVDCLRRDDRALIRITDSGPGLPPDSIGKIFDPYYRGDHGASGSKTGTGLGLSLVRHIARGHGGEANVESEPGQGSTFSIHLPLDA